MEPSFRSYQLFNSLQKCCRLKKDINSYSSYKQLYCENKKGKIGTGAWLLLAAPATALALGTWQVQRKAWKENLIEHLKEKTKSDPVPLSENLDQLNEMEFRPVYARGQFLHEKELHMGPRSLLIRGDAQDQRGLMSEYGSTNQGYLIITPFKLEGQNKTILVNRGWVPRNNKNPASRKEGQVEDVVDIVGIVRLQENRPNFMPKNDELKNQWFYSSFVSFDRKESIFDMYCQTSM
ncbi:surfeit locus protein 1 isoform X2 [Coccinella septempunctata]|uniref:surfeit locus protein 1 isoform X2 n=1 Tax=Coccinella septempunctata TaxID=41139 RepID=UPI001D07F6A8|nr:surfeit locus protein 1 isoform X2 [Coccinella septempunctata]